MPNLGCYVRLHTRIDGENIARPYTPISLHSDRGYVKFLIKVSIPVSVSLLACGTLLPEAGSKINLAGHKEGLGDFILSMILKSKMCGSGLAFYEDVLLYFLCTFDMAKKTSNFRFSSPFPMQTYRKNVHPNFPAGGKMTQFLESLTNDSLVEVSGPCGNLVYNGDGCFEIKGSNPRKIHAKRISMICGGTGLTPMYQLIQAIIKSDTDNTKIALLYANKTQDDILLKDELDKLRDDNPDQFRVWYTVESPPSLKFSEQVSLPIIGRCYLPNFRRAPKFKGSFKPLLFFLSSGWPYGVGYVDSGMLEEHIFPSGPDSFALMCGPPPMLQSACIPSLKAVGYTSDMYYAF
ncbi:unnamed protein product [Dibothriocephalus latus]|uniref:Cytochrome-b5 reductase n=1 Tax=Dibothriocephalus latus TaxID=60516 RepID=A0A3P7LIY1_DIBLA|nr:unnamed protein product [Dibothriocephalus latus]